MKTIHMVDSSTGAVFGTAQFPDELWQRVEAYGKRHDMTPEDVLIEAAREALPSFEE